MIKNTRENNCRIHKLDKDTSGFVRIPNDFLRAKFISAGAKGLLGFLLSYPEECVFRKSSLHTYFTEGVTLINTYWKELKELGYVEQTKTRVGERHFVYSYIFKANNKIAQKEKANGLIPEIGKS